MKQTPLRLKAVILDMDGVVTNTMPDHFLAWQTVLKEEGLHVTHLDIYRREGQRGIMSVKEMFELYKKPYTLKKIQRILKRKEKLFKRIVKTRFIPGARGFLRFLHSRQVQLALVTGTSRHEMHKILPDYLYNLFAVVITGSDVKKGKPHPEPYQKAIKLLQVRSKKVVVIENAPLGIQSAKAAGLTCYAIETSLPESYLRQADKIFLSIKDLQKNLKVKLSKNGNFPIAHRQHKD